LRDENGLRSITSACTSIAIISLLPMLKHFWSPILGMADQFSITLGCAVNGVSEPEHWLTEW
jgi:hypothetical protein